jgi:hypothetical protein
MGLECFRTLFSRNRIRRLSSLLPLPCLLLCSTLHAAQCADANYRKTDKGWVFGGKKVEDADVATFRILSGPDPYLGSIPCVHDSGYAADRFHVYWQGAVIPGADPKTFSYLQFGYSRDANHAYYRVAILSDADVRTFKPIAPPYFKDAAHVYLGGATIKDADPATFSLVSSSWFGGGDALARDARHVFFGATLVPEANPKDVVVSGNQYWVSNQVVFFKERPLSQADAASFHIASKGQEAFWAEDKAHYFVRSHTLDKTECREVGPAIVACKSYVWALGYKYSKLDPGSLHYLGGFPPKHCLYEGLLTYQDKHAIYFIDGNRMVERFLHSQKYPRIERLDKLNADRLCHLGGTADVLPDGWFDKQLPE